MMRKCLHCPHEGPDNTFAHYKDATGKLRPRNLCLECHRFFAAERQARYKARHPERIRAEQRTRKYLKYHNDPEFRARCIEESKRKK